MQLVWRFSVDMVRFGILAEGGQAGIGTLRREEVGQCQLTIDLGPTEGFFARRKGSTTLGLGLVGRTVSSGL
jgi:hypothetical protein